MTPPKKMSLQEFFSDESYGGSWADEDFDISSISVPIEKNKGLGYGGNSRYGASSRNFGGGGSSFLDNGPPYIVKLSNIPVTSNDAFINDLFRSRFTPLVKFKILFDPFSQPLELGIVKKVAFVELPSFESQNKVAKWQDVVYKGSRRVTIEVANFNDFQQSMQYNQENSQALLRVEQTFLSSGARPGHISEVHPGRGQSGMGRSPGGMPLDQIQLPGSKHPFGPQLGSRRLSNTEQQHTGSAHEDDHSLDARSKPKPNPFGSAKPIDVLARQLEIEKNLIVLKHTTHTAPWVEGVHQPPKSTQKSSNTKNPWGTTNLHGQSSNQTGTKTSLADILSTSKPKDRTKNPRAGSSNSTSKPVAKKPTILMKKPAALLPESQNNLQNTSKTSEESVTNTGTSLSNLSIDSGNGKELVSKKDGTEDATGLNQSKSHTSLDTHLNQHSEESHPFDVDTTPDTKKHVSEKEQLSEAKKLSGRRRSEKRLGSTNTQKDQSQTSSKTLSERRQRRDSNRFSERSSSKDVLARESGQRKSTDSAQSTDTQNETCDLKCKDGTKEKRLDETILTEPSTGTVSRRVARRPKRKSEVSKNIHLSDVVDSVPGSGAPKNDVPRESSSAQTEDHQTHLRGKGRGRGRTRGGDGEGRRRRRGRGSKEDGTKESAFESELKK